MIEYLPWSIQELKKSLDLYNNRKLSILDIEIGSSCNLCCIYCDSPQRNIYSNINVDKIEEILNKEEIRWLFICGLGEPLEQRNKEHIIEILKLCKKYSVKCSIFSNSLGLDDTILKYLKEKILYMLVKLDSLNKSKIEKIYKTDQSDRILLNLKIIEKYVSVKNNLTNIAASIVPTKLNKYEVPDLVKFCLQRNIFPLIGELEYSGSAKKIFNDIFLSNEELLEIEKKIESFISQKYNIPICPAVISGIHIDCNNNIIVDKLTGLSCSWFWLKTPKVKKITNLMVNDSLFEKILDYRNSKLENVKSMVNKIKIKPFGGCGGNIKYLLEKYIKIQEKFI